MSRQGTTGQPRALSLTEELEKLEQSITLTLQGKVPQRAFTESRTDPDAHRNRPQFQQSAPDSHLEYIADCGTIRKPFTRRMGGIKGGCRTLVKAFLG